MINNDKIKNNSFSLETKEPETRATRRKQKKEKSSEPFISLLDQEKRKMYLVTYKRSFFNEDRVFYKAEDQQEVENLFRKDFPNKKINSLKEVEKTKIFAITTDYQGFDESTTTYCAENQSEALESFEKAFPNKTAEIIKEVNSTVKVKLNNSYTAHSRNHTEEKMDLSSFIGGVFIFVVIGFFIYIFISDAPNDSEAIVAAQYYVKENLISPSTADFSWLDNSVTKLDENRYLVEGYVDSENSFGGNIRTYWEVIVIYQDDDWLLESIHFN